MASRMSTKREETLEELLDGWDREPFAIFMRRMELLIARRENELARSALDQFLAWHGRRPPTTSSPVGEVLPVKLANALEAGGYLTIEAAGRATDAELRRLKDVGEGSVAMVRAAWQAARSGQRIAQVVSQEAPELAPEWEIDWEFLARLAKSRPGGDRMSTSTSISMNNGRLAGHALAGGATPPTLSTALDLLTGDPEASAAQIDGELKRIAGQIEELRGRMKRLEKLRTVIGAPMPAASRRSSAAISKNWEQVEAKIFNLLKEGKKPMRPKDLAEALGVSYHTVGRVAARSKRLLSNQSTRCIELVA